jgi:hypothetical protein
LEVSHRVADGFVKRGKTAVVKEGDAVSVRVHGDDARGSATPNVVTAQTANQRRSHRVA